MKTDFKTALSKLYSKNFRSVLITSLAKPYFQLVFKLVQNYIVKKETHV